MISFNYVLTKGIGAGRSYKIIGKNNLLTYMDDIKVFAEKKLETGTDNKNIQPGYRNGIWHEKMSHAD